MTDAPSVVRVLTRPALSPERHILRFVFLSDCTCRVETWDGTKWVPGGSAKELAAARELTDKGLAFYGIPSKNLPPADGTVSK